MIIRYVLKDAKIDLCDEDGSDSVILTFLNTHASGVARKFTGGEKQN